MTSRTNQSPVVYGEKPLRYFFLVAWSSFVQPVVSLTINLVRPFTSTLEPLYATFIVNFVLGPAIIQALLLKLWLKVATILLFFVDTHVDNEHPSRSRN